MHDAGGLNHDANAVYNRFLENESEVLKVRNRLYAPEDFAEKRINVRGDGVVPLKLIHYFAGWIIMGHSSIAVTMEVYNHITEQARIEKEILKMEDLMVV